MVDEAKNVIGSILLVEDNYFMAELLTEKLKSREFHAIRARDGKEGLELVQKEKPSLVVIDLPFGGEFDGFKLVKKLREKYNAKSLSILMLFNRENPTEIEKALGLGITAFLVKESTDTDDIIQMIRDITQGKKLQQKAPEAKTLLPRMQKAVGGGALTSVERVEAPVYLKKRIEDMLRMPESEISIINLVDLVIEYAFLARASDIHLEPLENKFLARLRIDGMLHDVFTLPKTIQSGVITRIKVLAGMRTDEHQAAQDGRFKMALNERNRQFDIRVSIIPTYYGENSVLRLLAEQTQIRKLDDLAFTESNLKKIKNAIKKPSGMMLATGPTGSGKTTTLYTILKDLNKREVSIITIEDPIEYSIEGIDQIQVNVRTGLTFASGLRSILRQDPNIIMVGEIRDEETASIAVNAALTGHKLLSTLHTTDAVTTLPRLLDMGVEPYLAASTVNVAIGQRLVRMLCNECKVEKNIIDAEFDNLAKHLPREVLGDNRKFYYPKGCDACGGSGYFDRMGIYEVLEMNDFIRTAIMKRVDAGEIKKIALKNGMVPLLEDGFQKALAGFTSLEEILRVVRE